MSPHVFPAAPLGAAGLVSTIIHLPCHALKTCLWPSQGQGCPLCFASRMNRDGDDWRLPRLVLAGGHRRASIRAGPSEAGRAPYAYASLTLSGKPNEEANPSNFRQEYPYQPGVRSFPQSRCRILRDANHSPFRNPFLNPSSSRRAYSRVPVQRTLCFQSVNTAPCGTSPVSKYFRNATNNFLVKATMPIRR